VDEKGHQYYKSDLRKRRKTYLFTWYIIEGLRAKRAYIAFLANFHFLQDRANFWQTGIVP